MVGRHPRSSSSSIHVAHNITGGAHARSPVRMMSRNGSRGTGKVDSASSLEQGGDGAHPPHQHPPHHHQAAAAMQHQMGKMTLAE